MPPISLLLLAGTLAQNPNATSDTLPLEKLRLYETGVGYFERSGQVSGRKQTSLPLPSSHLDDALKTLVVLSNDRRVSIGGIEFPSSVSEGMARAIAGLPLEAETELGYYDLLASLEGVDVELTVAKEKVRGRLVEVLGPFAPARQIPKKATTESPAPKSAYPEEPEYTLVLRTKAGAMRRVKTRNLRSIRPTEDSANARFDVALAALSSRSPQAEQALKVHIAGSGPLKLGYIAETPVWRTTYRVVLDGAGDAATLQAWALIHNDTDEDWDDIDVELVNGRPTSFLFPLAAPRYARRDLAEPEVALSTIPQLLNTTADRIWGDFVDGEGGLTGTGYGAGGGVGSAYGAGGMGLIGVGHGGGGASEEMLGDLAEFAQATGEENGSLFTYQLSSGLDLAAHHSALVPVVQRKIEAESITWFSADDTEALAGARLLNSTDQTLPAGTVAFFDTRGFQGESGFNRLKPTEQTFAVHGADLDVDLERSKVSIAQELHDVRFGNDRLTESLVVESELNISLRNRSGRDRSVYVGLPVDRNAALTGHDQLDYDHIRSLPLAKFKVAAGKKVAKVLRAKENDARSTELAVLTSDKLNEMAASSQLAVQKRETLDEAAKLHERLEDNRGRRAERMTRITQLTGELEALRKDLQALGSAGVKDRSTRNLSQRVVKKEDEIESLREANGKAKRREERLLESIGLTLEKL